MGVPVILLLENKNLGGYWGSHFEVCKLASIGALIVIVNDVQITHYSWSICASGEVQFELFSPEKTSLHLPKLV